MQTEPSTVFYERAAHFRRSSADPDGEAARLASLREYGSSRPQSPTPARKAKLVLQEIPKKIPDAIPSFNLLKTTYWRLYRPLDDAPSRAILVTGILCCMAAGAPLPLIAVIFKSVVDEFPPEETQLDDAIYKIIGIAIAYFFVTWAWAVCWGITGERISRRLRESLVSKSLGMDLAFFEVDAPDLSTILTADTQTIQNGTSEKVGLFLQSISYFIATFITGMFLSAPLTGILIGVMIPTMVIIVVTGSAMVSKFSKRASEITEHAARVAEGAIKAVEVVQAFGVDHVLSDEHARILTNAGRAALRKSISSAVMLALVYFTAYCINSLAFYMGVHLPGGTSAGTIFAVVFLIIDASFIINQFGPFIHTFALAAAAGDKVFKLIDHDTPKIDVYSEQGKQVTAELFDSDIVFEDISFSYPARPSSKVLDSLSLRFKAGTMTGIVGMSGSGKSTIASLLLRLYDPKGGRVLIGEYDMTDLHVRSLRSHMSLVDQDPVLFTGTLLENIAHGLFNRDELTDEDILERCQKAAVDANVDFLDSLKDGMQTHVGASGGTSLSGGQKQRICLARALVRRPQVLILDEPTSALDATSETQILKALDNVSRSGCTVIMIAHRLATVKDADNIIVMNEGKFCEQGTHEELMAIDSAYKSLVDAQSMGSSNESMPSASEKSLLSLDSVGKESEKAELASLGCDQDVSSDKSSYSTRRIIKRGLSLSSPERFFILAGLLSSVVAGLLIVGEAIIFGNLVSTINTENDAGVLLNKVNFLALMFFIVALVALFSYGTSGAAFAVVSESLLVRLRDISLRTILTQDLDWFQRPGNSLHQLLASINTDSNDLSGVSGVIIGTIFTVSANITSGIIVAHVFAWKIAIVLLATVPAVVLAGFFRIRMVTKFDERRSTAYGEAAALASEAVTNIRTVAAFGREKALLQKYKVELDGPYRKSYRFNVLGNLALSFSYSLIYFVYSLAYWWGSQQVRSGDYSQKDFFVVLPAILLSAQASGLFFSLAPEVTRARTAARNIFRLHDQRPTIMKEEQLPAVASLFKAKHAHDSKLNSEKGSDDANEQSHDIEKKGETHIRLDSVSLIYPSRPDAQVLSDVSLSIERGQFIGLVGPSGAGKSSLISLLERFHDPTTGTVLVDEADIRGVPVREHRAKISLVSQEPELFAGSISFNIGLGARLEEPATQERIEDVCKQCGFHSFITSLAEGYDTECGQHGSKLSGGQKQRVAVARALIRQPEILLLDEATSALDSHSEKEVQDAIATSGSNRTTIVVAHRLSSVQHADRIFVFDGGKIVEQGTHEQLVALGGVYSAMVKAQTLA